MEEQSQPRSWYSWGCADSPVLRPWLSLWHLELFISFCCLSCPSVKGCNYLWKRQWDGGWLITVAITVHRKAVRAPSSAPWWEIKEQGYNLLLLAYKHSSASLCHGGSNLWDRIGRRDSIFQKSWGTTGFCYFLTCTRAPRSKLTRISGLLTKGNDRVTYKKCCCCCINTA